MKSQGTRIYAPEVFIFWDMDTGYIYACTSIRTMARKLGRNYLALWRTLRKVRRVYREGDQVIIRLPVESIEKVNRSNNMSFK